MAGAELSADEFCNSLAIRYGRTPNRLQPTCDGCGAMFSACHAFACAKGGLVIFRHNEIYDELFGMASKAFTPFVVRNEPKINPWCAAKEGTYKPLAKTEERGDVLMQGLLEQGTDFILDVRVMDTDEKTYKDK
jgi:hypothetical protein